MKDVNWDKISSFEVPDKSPGFLLWQVSTKWRREIEAALLAVGLTHPQFVLLANIGYLTKSNQNISQIELARQTKMDVTMTSQILRSLEKKEFIERKRQKGNDRSKFPYLTQKGVELVEKALPLVESVDQNFFQGLKQDVRKYIKLLQKLV